MKEFFLVFIALIGILMLAFFASDMSFSLNKIRERIAVLEVKIEHLEKKK